MVVPSEGGVSQQQEILVPASAGERLSTLLDAVAAALGRGAGAVVEVAGWDDDFEEFVTVESERDVVMEVRELALAWLGSQL